MPDMDGAATHEAFKHIDPGVRIILTSGHGGLEATRHFPEDDPPVTFRNPAGSRP